MILRNDIYERTTMTKDMVFVLPAMSEAKTVRCLESLHPSLHELILLVDNSPTSRGMYDLPPTGKKVIASPLNYGVARSWNLGIEYAREQEAEFLFVLSTSMTFGESAGLDLVDYVRKYVGEDVQALGTQPTSRVHGGFGWHLHGFRTSVFDVVGTFDEHFWPAYFEDTDMLYRMGLAGLDSPRENGRSWPYVHIDATLEREADAIKSGLVNIEFGRLEDYYVRKWGGKQGEETFTTPFGIERLAEYGGDYSGKLIDWRWWP